MIADFHGEGAELAGQGDRCSDQVARNLRQARTIPRQAPDHRSHLVRPCASPRAASRREIIAVAATHAAAVGGSVLRCRAGVGPPAAALNRKSYSRSGHRSTDGIGRVPALNADGRASAATAAKACMVAIDVQRVLRPHHGQRDSVDRRIHRAAGPTCWRDIRWPTRNAVSAVGSTPTPDTTDLRGEGCHLGGLGFSAHLA